MVDFEQDELIEAVEIEKYDVIFDKDRWATVMDKTVTHDEVTLRLRDDSGREYLTEFSLSEVVAVCQ